MEMESLGDRRSDADLPIGFRLNYALSPADLENATELSAK